ncbi:MAG: hypothetical protein ACHQ53_14535, partial [Polyangiales bacterium]
TAHAQSCATDADCMKGFACTVVGGTACAGVACPSGQACPPSPPCTSTDIKECRPGPCTMDSDCVTGMVCLASTTMDCPPAAQIDCPPNAFCAQPLPQPCVAKTEHNCVPRYLAPCKVDADCGAGFTCVQDATTCTSPMVSLPAPGAAGSAAPAPVPPSDPSCAQQGPSTFSCEAQQIACSASTDCPQGWSCGDSPTATVCSTPPTDPSVPAPQPGGASGGCGGAVPALCRLCPDGSCGAATCVSGQWKFLCPGESGAAGAGGGSTPPLPPPPSTCGTGTSPTRMCLPPFSDLGFAPVTGSGSASTTAGSAPGAGTGPQAPGGTPGSALPPVPAPQAAMPSGAAEQSAKNAGTATSAATSMGSPTDSLQHTKTCAVATPGARKRGAALTGWLGLLAALALRKRPRRK